MSVSLGEASRLMEQKAKGNHEKQRELLSLRNIGIPRKLSVGTMDGDIVSESGSLPVHSLLTAVH